LKFPPKRFCAPFLLTVFGSRFVLAKTGCSLLFVAGFMHDVLYLAMDDEALCRSKAQSDHRSKPAFCDAIEFLYHLDIEI
jgi:hypothetical protein